MNKLTVLFKWPDSTGFNLDIVGDFAPDDQGRQVTIFTGDSRPCKKRDRRLLRDGIYVIDDSLVKKIFVLVDPDEFPVDQDGDGWQEWLATLSQDIREGWRPVVDHDPWALIPTGIQLWDEQGFRLSINATGQQAGASLSEVNSPGGYYEGLLNGKSLVVFCFTETGDGPDRQIQDVFIGVIHDLQASWPKIETDFDDGDEPAVGGTQPQIPDRLRQLLAARRTE